MFRLDSQIAPDREEQIARELTESAIAFCREDDGMVLPVEAISAMSAIVGERCIVAGRV